MKNTAVNMFDVENTSLELVKTQLINFIKLYAINDEDVADKTEELVRRFDRIEKLAGSIRMYLGEDSVLLLTLQVHFNSLLPAKSLLERFKKTLSPAQSIYSVMSFTYSLEIAYECLAEFYIEESRQQDISRSLQKSDNVFLVLPFIIKAYSFRLPSNIADKLFETLYKLVYQYRETSFKIEFLLAVGLLYEEFTDENRNITSLVDWVSSVQVTDLKLAKRVTDDE